MTCTEYRQLTQKARRKNKYHAKKAYREVNGVLTEFDSQREAQRWDELCMLQSAGKIQDLKRQVRFVLIPPQRERLPNGKPGKVIEREVAYIADFFYRERGETVVEDAKGCKTPEYIIKRKLMLERKGIRVREV